MKLKHFRSLETAFVAQPMLAFAGSRTSSESWAAPVSGTYLSAANWNTHVAPTSSTAATIAAVGTYTVTIGLGAVAQSLLINAAGASVVDTGSLQVGGTLAISSGRFVLDYGALDGATIVTSPGGKFVSKGGTLTNDTVNGTLTLVGNGETTLKNVAFNGADGSGRGLINVVGIGSTLLYNGAAVISNAVVRLGAGTIAGGGISGATITDDTSNSTLTIAADTTIVQVGAQASIVSGGGLVVDGIIDASTSGGSFTLNAYGGITNNGRISVSNGDTLFLGSATSALINSIHINNGTLELEALVTGGTIVSPTDNIALGNGGTLSAVKVDGTLTINTAPSNGDATLNNGVQFAGVNGTGSGVLDFGGTSFVDSPGPLTISNSSSLAHVTVNMAYEGTFYLGGPTGTFTLAADTTINAGYDTEISAQNGLTNRGTLNVTKAASDVYIYAKDFANDGAINVSGGSTLNVTGAGSVPFVNSVNVTDGTLVCNTAFDITSPLALQAGETLDPLGGGTIASNISGLGTLLLNTSNSFTIEPDTAIGATLAVYGTFLQLTAGTDLTLAAGDTWLINGNVEGPSDSSVTINGTLLGGGSFGVHVLDAGTINVGSSNEIGFGDAGATITGTLSGTGTALVLGSVGLTIDAGAVVTIDNIIQNGGPVTLGDGVSLTRGAQQAWLLENAQISGGANSAIVNGGILSASGSATSSIRPAFDNVGQISASSGTLQFLGTLTNSGAIGVAGGDLYVASSVTGTGTIAIGGPASVHQGPVTGIAELHGIVAGQTIDFVTTVGTLLLDSPSGALGTIAGFSVGDTITLSNTFETGFSFSKGVLTVSDGSATAASLSFSGAYTKESFSVVNAGSNVVLTHT